jgi:formiminotetrahydrofolate cyclodeaminase
MSMIDHSLAQLLDQLADKTPTPGGGAVAPIAGALAAALAAMSIRFSEGSKGLEGQAQAHHEALEELERARALLLVLGEEDASAYSALSDALGLPRSDPQRAELIPKLALVAMQVPLTVIATGVELLRLFEQLAPITNRFLRSDLHVAAVLIEASVRAARVMVEANVPLAPDEDARQMADEADGLVDQAAKRLGTIGELCGSS